MRKVLTICLSLFLLCSAGTADAARKRKARIQFDPQKELKDKLNRYFINYKSPGQLLRSPSHLNSLTINDTLHTIEVCADTHFGEQVFTPQSADNIYKELQELLPDTCRNYDLSIKTGGWDIRQLIPNRL